MGGTEYLDTIKPGATSITDTELWRDFCRRAAADLTLLDADESVFRRIISRRDHAEERYRQIAARIERLIGPWGGWRIIEVGGGYGGQAHVMLSLASCTYSILDLPEPLELQRVYLESLGFFLHGFVAGAPYDLFISNYALSECARDVQASYLQLAATCPRGYITWNGWTHDGLTLEEARAFLPSHMVTDELFVPSPDPDEREEEFHALNSCIIW